MILVIAEQKDGKLNRASWEALAAAGQLAAKAGPIKVAVLGHNIAAAAAELATAAVDEVLVVDDAGLGSYTPDRFVTALAAVIGQAAPDYVLLPHTYQTRDFVPTLAARIDRALVTDVIAVKADGATPTFARPMFQGKLVADVALQGPAPHLVSMQIGAYRADTVLGDAAQKGSAPATITNVAAAAGDSRQITEPPFQEAKQAVDLSQAERIVAVGRGIKQQENVQLAEKLAAAFGAELAASRPICDNGWLPMERQIGSSGQTVAPKLYVALGISGAIQHLVGMKGARTIVAINKDAEAPIFEIADYGIAGDLFEIAPALIAELQKS
jgi:electron transfer flavoprotein alpha subunit